MPSIFCTSDFLTSGLNGFLLTRGLRMNMFVAYRRITLKEKRALDKEWKVISSV